MTIDLLQRLCETPGIPGREERVRALIQEEVADLFDEVEVDPLGSLICRRHPRSGGGARAKKAAKRVAKKAPDRAVGDAPIAMLLCHMDEIGFHVSSIDENGFLWVDPAGGFDPRNLFSRRVLVVTDSGEFRGVMNPGGRPIHISKPDERTKVPDPKEFFVDLGMTAAQVDKNVQVGDYIVMDEPFVVMGDKLVSKAMDNRVACWLGIEAIREMDRQGLGNACEIVVAFTVQEEVGLRGAKAAAYAVRPRCAVP